jgi:uncharacterized membrane protein YphA (DoxX/SURF4 family)
VLQRLFSGFPDGGPGAGLLLLRAAAGGTVAVQGAVHVLSVGPSNPGACVIGVLAVAGGILVLLGFLTPVNGALVALSMPLFWYPNVSPGLFLKPIGGFLLAADAAAIALLGPGAFSIDARLFGRREILFVRDPPASK